MSEDNMSCKIQKFEQMAESFNKLEIASPEMIDDRDADGPVGTTTFQIKEGGEEEEGVEIPGLVVELLLDRIKDVELLKTCRLVNKYWNSLACASLQIYSIVNMDFDGGLKEFLDCQEPKTFGGSALMPSPFKNIYFKPRFLSNSFLKLAKRQNINITRLELSLSNTDKISHVNKFLRLIMEDLISLTLKEIRHDVLDQVFQDVKFTALKSLTLGGCDYASRELQGCNSLLVLSREGTTTRYNKVPYKVLIPLCNNNNIDALKRTLENSILQQLTIDLCNPTYCIFELLTINLSGIVEITFKGISHLCNYSDIFWNLIGKLKLPSLKSAHFDKFKFSNMNQYKQLNAFLQNVAPNLNKLYVEHVSLPFQNSWLQFKGIVFPVLRILRVSFPESFFEFFNPEIFPSLKELHLTRIHVTNMELTSNRLNSLTGVRLINLSFSGTPLSREIDEFVTVFPTFILYLTRQFPNIQSLEILQEGIPWIIPYVCQAYPHLKSLRIKSDLNFMALFRASKDEKERYLRLGIPIPRRPSVFLKELETLSLVEVETTSCIVKAWDDNWMGLGPESKYENTLTSDVFKHGLLHFATLKNLECSWTRNLDECMCGWDWIMAYSLKHLKRLTIYTGLTYRCPSIEKKILELRKDLRGCDINIINCDYNYKS